MTSDRLLRILLRAEGILCSLALIAVVMPRAWMDAVHRHLHMGPLPPDPIVGYLARSTSAFYAILGIWMWILASDLRRHRPSILYLGLAAIFLGIMLTIVDWTEGMPTNWSLWEGPYVITFGTVIFLLARRIPRS